MLSWLWSALGYKPDADENENKQAFSNEIVAGNTACAPLNLTAKGIPLLYALYGKAQLQTGQHNLTSQQIELSESVNCPWAALQAKVNEYQLRVNELKSEWKQENLVFASLEEAEQKFFLEMQSLTNQVQADLKEVFKADRQIVEEIIHPQANNQTMLSLQTSALDKYWDRFKIQLKQIESIYQQDLLASSLPYIAPLILKTSMEFLDLLSTKLTELNARLDELKPEWLDIDTTNQVKQLLEIVVCNLTGVIFQFNANMQQIFQDIPSSRPSRRFN